jgi:hypothetical protein
VRAYLRFFFLVLIAALAVSEAIAQGGGRGFSGGGGGRGGRTRFRPGTDTIDRGAVPTWPMDSRFAYDHFTFTRIKYASTGWERSSYAWFTDFPGADLNLSFRLQQLTAIRVNPDPLVLELSDSRLSNYPWCIMSGPGNMVLTDGEAARLGAYLRNGGFLMVDDFWGQAEWDGVMRNINRALPGCEVVDLLRSHAIFHCVCDIPDSLNLQTPNIGWASRNRNTGITWEDDHVGGNTRDPHFRAIHDDKGRMMVFLCHNTDNGDGWEEESTDPWFFSTYSEKKNYPLAINVIYYVMTH